MSASPAPAPAATRWAAVLALASLAQALGTNVGLGVALERFGAAGLPLLTIAHAAIVAALSVASARRAERTARAWLVGSLAGGGVLLGVGLALRAGGAVVDASTAGVYLTAHVVGDLGGAFFWVVLGAAFDMRSAKRALPRIAAAGTSGAALGGFAAPLVARVAGAHGLLAVATLASVAAAVAAASLLPVARDAGATLPSSPVLRRSMPAEDRSLAWAIVAGAVTVSAVTIAGRLLYARALDTAYAGDATRIVAWNGVLAGAASVATALLQVTVAPAMLSRLGVRAAMLVYPLAMAAVFVALGAHFALLTGVVAHFATTVLRKGLQAPSEGVLPAALPRAHAARVLLWASALGAPLGMGLAGAGLRALGGRPAAAQALVGLGLALALVAVTVWRGRSYLDALRLRLRKGGSELRLRLGGELGGVSDVRAVLGAALDADDPALSSKLETLVRLQREADGGVPPSGTRRAVAGDARRSAQGAGPAHEGLERIVARRLGEALRLRAAARRLDTAGLSEGLRALWLRAVHERLEQDAVVVIHALRLLTGDTDLDRLAPRLFDSDTRARGAAMEVLEASCPPAWRAPLLALVEDRATDVDAPTSMRLGAPAADPVEDLLAIADDWLRAVTICALAERGDRRHHARIAALRGSEDRWLALACARYEASGARAA